MKYILMMQCTMADWQAGNTATWSESDIKANRAFLGELNGALSESGELVLTEGLAGPESAVLIQSGRDAAPLVTDGPFPETKEYLIGFWIVDVASTERAHQIAAEISRMPGPGGTPSRFPIEARQVMTA